MNLKLWHIYVGCIIALLLLPFVRIGEFIYAHRYFILQCYWILLFSCICGVSVVMFVASIVYHAYTAAALYCWCYLTFGTLACYDYKYAIRRWF